jgi:hypothetical protein
MLLQFGAILSFIGGRVLLHHAGNTQKNACRAVAALEGALFKKRLLHGMEFLTGRQSFNREDGLLVDAAVDVRQEGVGSSFSSTVQARHSPSPQPYFAPVRCRSSRRTSSRVRSGSTVNVCGFPFSLKVMVAAMRTPSDDLQP